MAARYSLRVFGATAAVRGDGFQKRGFDVGGHAFGVAADVEVAALIEPAPEFGGVLADAVLDVNLEGLIAGEGEIEPVEEAGFLPGKEFVLVEEVLLGALIAEEEPHGPASAAGLLVLKISAEGRDAGAGTDHDHGHVGIGGQAEELVGVDEDGQLAAGGRALADIAGADAEAVAAMSSDTSRRGPRGARSQDGAPGWMRWSRGAAQGAAGA